MKELFYFWKFNIELLEGDTKIYELYKNKNILFYSFDDTQNSTNSY